jgi:ComF family protein
MFCRKENKVGQLIIVAELSDHLVDKMLKAYKYKFVYSMTVPLSAIAEKRINKLASKNFSLFKDNPLLIPVPLHKKRLNWRGFNQAGLLAKDISDAYHMSYRGDVLARIADPKHQADIKAKEDRINNVRSNFVVTDSALVRGRTIILVDDICTTGATLNECARILKESGAKKVIGFVIARGQFKR